jgi:hypothetical protein
MFVYVACCFDVQVLDHLKGRTIEINAPEGLQPSGLKIVCILNPLTRPAQRISQVWAAPTAPYVASWLSIVDDNEEMLVQCL